MNRKNKRIKHKTAQKQQNKNQIYKEQKDTFYK
jgi:hypothetical protein